MRFGPFVVESMLCLQTGYGVPGEQVLGAKCHLPRPGQHRGERWLSLDKAVKAKMFLSPSPPSFSFCF